MSEKTDTDMAQALRKLHKRWLDLSTACTTNASPSYVLQECAAEVEAILALHDTARAQPASVGAGWISVRDQLPGSNAEDVLVRYRYTDEPDRPWDIGESFYDPTHDENGGWCFGSCYYAEVSHWMPKSALLAATPQPAKENDHE